MKVWKADEIAEAAQVLKEGGLVAFPTETVYGLGGNGLNSETAAAIYRAKGRPQDNPLILHIAEVDDMKALAVHIPEAAWTLAEAFWPGPLTMILEKAAVVPYATTGGLDTVAIRLPDSTLARQLIRACGFPLAAPSANRSGKPSPTEEAHVLADLADAIDGIVLGGKTQVGVESTIVDLTGEKPVVLRPGAISPQAVAEVLHTRTEAEPFLKEKKLKAPGMKYRHYAPNTPVVMVAEEDLIDYVAAQKAPCGVLAKASLLQALQPNEGTTTYSLGDDVETAAHELFRGLRQLDQQDCEIIITHSWPQEGLGLALMNRLEKVCGAFQKKEKTV